MPEIGQDIRMALRVWRKRPLIAATAILTIALGAGMNLAVSRTIWTVMLKPLPFPHPEQLMQVWVEDGREERGAPENTIIERWQESSRSFTHLANYRGWRVTVTGGKGDPEQVFTGLVSPQFFDVFGVRLLAGRMFTAEQARSGNDNVVLLREGYWRSRFGADATILGREIAVDGMLCRVTGIVPDSFESIVLGTTTETDLYLPISRARVAGMRVPLRRSPVIGRLQPWATAEQARAELARLAEGEKRRVWLSPLRDEIGRQLRPALLALFAATACVLLIACANFANLLMAQAVLRQREFAVRAALGAPRSRLVRQVLTEAAVLIVAGSIVSVGMAALVMRLVTAVYPGGIPRMAEEGPQWMVYGVALGGAIAMGVLFGAVPAWRTASRPIEDGLRVGQSWMGRGNRRLADGMVGLQVALTAVVLIAAGFLFRSFLSLRAVDPGIAREHVITASVDLPEARYRTREDRARFGAELVEHLWSLPGVAAAGISNSLPLRYTTLLDVLVKVPGKAGEQKVGGRAVGGSYFEAIGMTFVAGGPFDEKQKHDVVVNQAFVRRYLPGIEPVDAPLGLGRIRGVVKDVRHLGLREAPQPELYMPFANFPLNPVDIVVRSSLPAGQLEAALRSELRNVDSQLALGRVMTMSQVMDDQLARPRFQAMLLGLFAVVALSLAAVGTYGVVAHTVRGRVPEYGLRRALGADTFDLVGLVLRDGLKAPLAGLGVGLTAGWLVAGRVLESLLYGVGPHDTAVVLTTAAVLLLAALLACAAPGRFAARVDPSRALRQE